MYNNYYQNAAFINSRGNTYNHLARMQMAQEYFKRLSMNNSYPNFVVENKPYSGHQSKTFVAKENQKLLIVRHGERVDSYFGPIWIQNSFNKDGEYVRSDANMPRNLIYRENPYEFEFDPPLTENGLNQARIHGEELAKTGIRIKYMYSSPALRSIQTADKILEGMGLKDKVPIRIEIGLFELLSWQMYVPNKYPWIDKINLKNFGYNIDIHYKPFIVYENLKRDETIYDYYQRSHYVAKKISEQHDDGHIMFVGHAPSLEGISRLFTGEYMRTVDEFAAITRRIPFLSIAHCEKDQTGKWRLTPLLSSYEKLQKDRSFKVNVNRPVYHGYQ
ncbi:unnamed protein product [Brachionus calyciflorus]|uniref:Protein UBASH3A-like protein n=1 Tax=Brachionus calyciflorus TaxID=104777 RepID=A0A814DDE1_9BILA|nr:unnamed protein product [Brachionus calyciflorus]